MVTTGQCPTYLHTLALRQTDPGLLLADNKDIALTSGKLVINGILDVHDIEASIVSFSMGNHPHSTHVTTTGDHCNDSSVKVDEVANLSRGEIDLDSIIHFDGWIRVSNPRYITPE